MSSKITELTESSPSVLLPSVLCGSGIISWLHSPWSMASSGNFDPSQTYDGYKAVEGLDPDCTECLMKGRQCFQHYNPCSSKRYLWSKKDGSFGKEFPVTEAPTPDGTSGYCKFRGRWLDGPMLEGQFIPVQRFESQGLTTKGCDEPDGEEVEVVLNSVGHQSSTSPSQHVSKIFQSQVIPSTPRSFQPVLYTIPSSIPPPSPNPSTARPSLVSQVRPSPITQPRNSPMVTSQQLQSVAGSSRRREDGLPLLFPAAKVIQ
ncbi:hypothetical protein O181_051099 [Austropuccinia psidii MF-1]|uniref:Uncharacterized protein n=1 Tax=Austropuccinia psidii MF-1 TaxID=1389203 RepID=A0A9Q3DY08_9BASI|nr:hypothetical protein [Austropuccinia psidii MF-1]